VKQEGQYKSILVNITNISISGTPNTLMSPVTVLLDSGNSVTHLPAAALDKILIKLGGVKSQNSDWILVDCNLRSSGISIAIGFGTPASYVYLSLNDIVYDFFGTGETPFENTCQLGLIPSEDDSYVLGDTFLRYAYVVYDLDLNQVSFAQASFNSKSSHVVEITTPRIHARDSTATSRAEASTTIATSSSKTVCMPMTCATWHYSNSADGYYYPMELAPYLNDSDVSSAGTQAAIDLRAVTTYLLVVALSWVFVYIMWCY
jgi:hypothetical protein